MSLPVSSQDGRPARETKILSLGMTRTGSASISQALVELGYDEVHHGLVSISAHPQEWSLVSEAADASFPSLPTYTGKPFTRAQWNEVFGPYEAVTDMGSFFALQLIEAYPEAKVILVERDIEAWYRSMDVIFDTNWGLRAWFLINILDPWFGLKGVDTIRKIICGFYGESNIRDIRSVARTRYREHYAGIRAAVPKDRLLEYDIQKGWGPLCAFLGKDVPGTPFPTLNKRDEYLARSKFKRDKLFKYAAILACKKMLPWTLGLGAVFFGAHLARTKFGVTFVGLMGEALYRAKSILKEVGNASK